MLWIGLTGGLASGKSTVAKILQRKNIEVVSADILARQAVAPGTKGLSEIVSLFGADLVLPTGELDRKKLAAKVFGQKPTLEQLENILHPIIRNLANEAREKLEDAGKPIAFYDVPLLFEKKMEELFDMIVLVTTSEENQILRAIARDLSNETEVKSRLGHQIPLAQKLKLADYIIENNQGVEELEKKVDEMLLRLTNPKNSRHLR